MDPTYFVTPEEFRTWLEEHHTIATELLVGFHKKGTGRPSITWSESVDQALCFGWIDGVRRSLGAESYCIRFTPRRPGSTWSAVNIAKVAELTDRGLMHPAGLRAFEKRTDANSAIYSHERRDDPVLDEEQRRRFQAEPDAWEWFQAQPPGYRKTVVHWVTSAKRPETREKRLAQLITESARGRRLS
ncbi:uncharacterized protein YdeI (YjbR/CyaY-like superfamily) [Streptosporangium becharense]|uniref:Uncharacterized protein YdeI (YjbR/CyaY-like superfamily) n=1 Tax=Streptosporangium becharense TaxID=1816182 RepID=A0A7W9IK27_9ACTN|nr:YdeI/OmpD-associated family protein [Streptosporangium becharense]MBB2911206.1 uncharacterized protein YdeI (YjbR/CyaY-like superfamily) [Streptosporangium becharense]MBB5821736.1 uncharacterized protein YdeI (YjbR/CyaY-like superfamily) [Streptosporangium becharense]